MVRIADYGQNPQAACDGPRFRWILGMKVSVEDGFPRATVDELRRRGHDLVVVDDYNQLRQLPGDLASPDGYLGPATPRRDGQGRWLQCRLRRTVFQPPRVPRLRSAADSPSTLRLAAESGENPANDQRPFRSRAPQLRLNLTA